MRVGLEKSDASSRIDEEGNELLDKLLQIGHKTGLILDCGHSRGRPGHEKGYETPLKILIMYLFPYFGSDVDNVTESNCFLDDLVGVNLDHVKRFSVKPRSEPWHG